MTNRKKNNYLLLGVATAFLLYIVVLVLTPSPIDWSLSFSKNDKIPYGNSILFNELGQVYPANDIKISHSPIYNFWEDSIGYNIGVIYINNSFKPDKFDTEKLLDIALNGGNVFIAAVEFSKLIEDTLGFKVEEANFVLANQDSLTLKLVNNKLRTPWGYTYKKAYHKVTFLSYDTLSTTVLGIDDKAKTNFVRIKHGKGHFFINTNPLAFTNYNLLEGNNYEYAFKCLSYLPKEPVIWDEYYKPKGNISNSPVRYILSQKALRYAWYILLFGIVTYMIFGAKRRQRMIPILAVPQNTTLTFIKTVGRLYLKKKNHLDMAQKKYTYFLEFLRSKYFIQTSNINAQMYDEISEKCAVPLRTVKQLFEMANKLEQVQSISEEDLEQFNNKIEFFYDKCKATNK